MLAKHQQGLLTRQDLTIELTTFVLQNILFTRFMLSRLSCTLMQVRMKNDFQ